MNSVNKTISSYINQEPKYILRIATPNMGLVDVKTVDSTANVINKVEVSNTDVKLITIFVVLIFVILVAHLLYKLYKYHNKCIKKRYQSQANDLDKI